jgi:hypothetical protein
MTHPYKLCRSAVKRIVSRRGLDIIMEFTVAIVESEKQIMRNSQS